MGLQVKDHESAIQDNLLDQLHDFLMAPTGKVGHALGRSTNSAQTKLDSLCPILTALGSLSAAEQMCLGRACSMLSARRRLQGKNVIAGLEEVIKNIGTIFFCSLTRMMPSYVKDVCTNCSSGALSCILKKRHALGILAT